MKKILLGLCIILGLSGCLGEFVIDPSNPNIAYQYGCATVCDDYGCREVCNVQYYYGPDGVVYWDPHFGAWIGPGGYWWHGRYYRGRIEGYRSYYHRGYYRSGVPGVFHGGRGGHR